MLGVKDEQFFQRANNHLVGCERVFWPENHPEEVRNVVQFLDWRNDIEIQMLPVAGRRDGGRAPNHPVDMNITLFLIRVAKLPAEVSRVGFWMQG